ncbi:hypothetical protein DB88DRAFT_481048 [Papiliotrema laurentii]|uniref:Uncharacterized protein n=1 Tax=Papiliotrema laurentii TaxID=5418 RepID=A0AAD9FU80_PAPLA|nr:hypothetical protein DB88DRAFT_481048 [Papiliotrema laurentii]
MTALEPPRSLAVLTRSESNPSSASTITIGQTSPPSSPEEIEMRLEEVPVRNEVQAAGKHSLGRLYSSKSMPGLKGQKDAPGSWKARTLSGGDSNPVVMPRPAAPRSRPSLPIPATKPSKVEGSKSNGGGFSAFIRKLTGRSASPPKVKLAAPQSARPEPRRIPSRSLAAPPMTRSSSASSAPIKPSLTPLKVDVRLDTLAPASAPAAPQPGTIRAGPFPTSPKRPLERPEPVDPCQIPLPPSPQLSPIHDDETSDGEEVDTVSEMGSSSTSVSRDDTTLKRTKPSGMLSLQGFDFDEEDEEEELAEREASENGDMVRDLRPIRIPSNSGRSGLGSAYPDTPASANSAIEEIVTPTSSEGSPPRGFSTKLAGSSPPRKAPIGTSLGADLGRKESKWRKSIMGLSDITANKKTLSKRTSTREPPTSYDAYLAHQKRMANNRQSCAPTLHSQASVAAEAREIRDRDESDMAEVFFCS